MIKINNIDDERYNFTWSGKRRSIHIAQQPSKGTLRPVKEKSKNWDKTQNLYIEGDNLEVLKLLQKSYFQKVKMIYIDPPYNTGNDFVYKDDYKDGIENYLEQTGQVDSDGNKMSTNTESNGRYHSDWLNMMYPRLKLARNLLKDDGVIFISIDDNEVDNMRKICDEIFGHAQFVAQITLLCNPKGRSQDKYVANCHEYLLMYSKFNLPAGSVSIPKTKDEIVKDYPLVDKKGNAYREIELRNTHRDFGKFNRPNLWYPIYVLSDGSVSLSPSTESKEVFPIWDDGFEGCWTWGFEKANKEIGLLIGKQISGKWKVFRKVYAFDNDQAPLKQVKSIWNDKMFYTEKGQGVINGLFRTKEKVFQSPKSLSMIKQCIQMSQSKDAIILDFFSGSATTAHATMQMNAKDNGNRKYIMVQLEEPVNEKSEAYKAGYRTICDIGEERIRRAGEKIKKELVEKREKEGMLSKTMNPDDLDIGFKIFRLSK